MSLVHTDDSGNILKNPAVYFSFPSFFHLFKRKFQLKLNHEVAVSYVTDKSSVLISDSQSLHCNTINSLE